MVSRSQSRATPTDPAGSTDPSTLQSDQARFALLGPKMSIGPLWDSLLDRRRIDDVLDWPPDVLAVVDGVLELSEAYRFLVSPPPGFDVTVNTDFAQVEADDQQVNLTHSSLF